ncbi:MAG: hypothetical protein CVT89_06560, partial [Candidatus Altiarchaeales archaeon HGW-Altiarchaeales-2]
KAEDVIARADRVLIRHFNKIPNAKDILEKLASDKAEDVIARADRVLIRHFNKIPNAKYMLEKLASDPDSYVRETAKSFLEIKNN